MPSDDGATRRWLMDIQYHIGMAQGFVAGTSYETFKSDNLRLYAVTRCLEIISEGMPSIAGGVESAASVNSVTGLPTITHRHMLRTTHLCSRRVLTGRPYLHFSKDAEDSRRTAHLGQVALSVLLTV
jgi:hypothetical protein